jgi:hypothetical protein
MSNNTLKKPILLPTASGYNPQHNNLGNSAPNSGEMQNPTVSVQNPQNVYFINGNPTIPFSTPASSQQVSSDHEQRILVLENRITSAIEKLEQMMKVQEESKVQRLTFGGNLFRPATADGFVQNRPPTFGVPQNSASFAFGSRPFERPYWFGSESNQNQSSFAKAKGLFEQQQAPSLFGQPHSSLFGQKQNSAFGFSQKPQQDSAFGFCHKPQQSSAFGQTKPMKFKTAVLVKNKNLDKMLATHEENNLDIIDGIVKPNAGYSLRDISDDEN